MIGRHETGIDNLPVVRRPGRPHVVRNLLVGPVRRCGCSALLLRTYKGVGECRQKNQRKDYRRAMFWHDRLPPHPLASRAVLGADVKWEGTCVIQFNAHSGSASGSLAELFLAR